MSKDAKLLRGSIRAIVKETFPDLFTKETQDTMLKQLTPLVTEAMASIRKEVLEAVERSKEQTKANENQLLKEAGAQLNQMRASLSAWETVLSKHLDLACVIDKSFQQEVDTLTEKLLANMKEGGSNEEAISA